MRLALALILVALPALAQDAGRPRHNSSYVPADKEAIVALVDEARRAAERGNHTAAADRLQALILTKKRGLVALKPRLLFVSAHRWAQIQLLSETPPYTAEVLAAWRTAHDAEANRGIAAAIRAGDVDGVLQLIYRNPAATAAPMALIALSDRALQHGDRDAALGYLLRVPEHVAPSEEATLLASEAYMKRRAHLLARPPAQPEGWPTIGGSMSRARAGDAIPGPGRIDVLWDELLLDRIPDSLRYDATRREHSAVLPFYPVCDSQYVYVHLGTTVMARSRASGKLLFYAPEGSEPDSSSIDTILARNPGVRAATVADGVLYFNRVLEVGDHNPKPRLYNSLIAFDVKARRTLWQVRPGVSDGDDILARPVFFRGAPAIAGERLFVYGAIRDTGDDGATRREEAFLFCFERRTGRLLWHRDLGYGDTDAAPEFPPFSGLAPAVSAGVVAVVTGLGVAATFDARTGEILWLFRYDRRPMRERGRLVDQGEEKKVHLRSGWMREPPRIVGDTVYFAAFDAEELYACWLRGARQPTQVFEIEQWPKDRARGHRHSLLEYVAGTAGKRIYYVGRRDPRPSMTVTYQAVVSHPLDRAVGLGYGLIPHLERDPRNGAAVPPEIFGRPAIAGDVLCVPTRNAVFRFDVGREPDSTVRNGERRTEIALLPPLLAPPRTVPEGEERPAAFGTLVAVDGVLFAVTEDRIICYGRKP